MPMKIGQLRHRVDILQRTVSVESGVATEIYSVIATVWVSVEPVSGREYFVAAAVQEEDSVRFRLRYRGDLYPEEHRLRYNGRDYDVYSVLCTNERKEETIAMARWTRELGGG